MNLGLFESGLLAVLALPLIMKYGIIPGEVTPYWLFGIIFIVLFGNILLHFIHVYDRPIRRFRFLNWITPAVIILVLGGVMWTQIANRGLTAPGQNMGTHDIVLQLEAALRYLGNGKNPYKETYFGTPMESWHYAEGNLDSVNPALYHFVMPPWYLLFSYPFYFVSMRTLGYFDGRIPLLFCIFGILITIHYLFRLKPLGRIAMILLLLSPGAVDYVIEGRSDLFALFWLLFSMYLFKTGKYILACIIFSLAIWSKQTVWFAVPVVIAYAVAIFKYNIRKLTHGVLGGLIISTILLGPFLYWNSYAFIDSLIFYLNGNTARGYPISGYGLGMLLYNAGFISNVHDYYPFWIWQMLIAVPMLIVGMKWVFVKPVLSRIFLAHGISLFAFWYMSRYFNNSHALYIASLLMLSVLIGEDERLSLYEGKNQT